MKRNISQLVHSSSNIRLKSHDSYGETHHSKCSVFAFDFETCIKTILKLIGRLINEALLVADHVSVRCCFSSLTSLVPHWFLINMSTCVSVSVDVSRRWCIRLLLWCLVHCCSNSCCQTSTKLLATFASSAPCVRKSTELLWHKTRNFTLDVASQQTRPPFRRLQIIQNHSRMRLAETAKDVKHCWWVVVINRITSFINRRTYYFSQGRVETPIRRGWHFVKVLLQIYYSICVPKIIKKYNAVW